jgi:hypothetical protein
VPKFIRKFELRTEKLLDSSRYTVPEYVVGSGQLLFFYNGLLCILGEQHQYIEIGNEGDKSTEIQIKFDFDINDEITIIVFNLLD